MAGVEARGFANGIPADEEGMFQICERLARFCRGFGLPDQARKDGFEDVGGLRINAVKKVIEEFEVFVIECRATIKVRLSVNQGETAPCAV